MYPKDTTINSPIYNCTQRTHLFECRSYRLSYEYGALSQKTGVIDSMMSLYTAMTNDRILKGHFSETGNSTGLFSSHRQEGKYGQEEHGIGFASVHVSTYNPCNY
jgi:hypothetical protein